MAHVNLPGYVPLHKFLSVEVLQEIRRLGYEISRADVGPLGKAYRTLIENLPDAATRLAAIRELGLVAQAALKRVG